MHYYTKAHFVCSGTHKCRETCSLYVGAGVLQISHEDY